MLWIATAAVVAASSGQPGPTTVGPERQARAVVRIVSAARITLGEVGEPSNGVEEQGGVLREGQVRDRDGTLKPSILVEFP